MARRVHGKPVNGDEAGAVPAVPATTTLHDLAAKLEEQKGGNALDRADAVLASVDRTATDTTDKPADKPAADAAAPATDKDSAAAPDKAAAPADKPFVYDEWFNAQPAQAREQFARNVYDGLTATMKKNLGDEIFALLDQAHKDPELKKKLGRLTDKELQSFVFETAYSIHDGTGDDPAGVPAIVKDPRVDNLERELNELRQRNETEAVTTARRDYETQRGNELQALVSEFPELRYDISAPTSSAYLKVQDIIDRTEAKSQREGRMLSYAETYRNMQRAWGETSAPPRPAPSTSSPDIPASRQAPRSEKESAQRMRATLEKHGGLTGLANALKTGR